MSRALRIIVLALTTTLLISMPLASQAAVTVDPGSKVSAGKTIIGTGQNLPTLDSTQA